MTSWLIGHYGGWRVAMAGAPVTDLIDQAYLSDGGWDEFMGGGPYGGNRFEAYRAQSPITYAANIRTPTLVMANTGDFRVPMPQPLKLYRALKDNGVETKFIAYPISGHDAADPDPPARRPAAVDRVGGPAFQCQTIVSVARSQLPFGFLDANLNDCLHGDDGIKKRTRIPPPVDTPRTPH